MILESVLKNHTEPVVNVLVDGELFSLNSDGSVSTAHTDDHVIRHYSVEADTFQLAMWPSVHKVVSSLGFWFYGANHTFKRNGDDNDVRIVFTSGRDKTLKIFFNISNLGVLEYNFPDNPTEVKRWKTTADRIMKIVNSIREVYQGFSIHDEIHIHGENEHSFIMSHKLNMTVNMDTLEIYVNGEKVEPDKLTKTLMNLDSSILKYPILNGKNKKLVVTKDGPEMLDGHFRLGSSNADDYVEMAKESLDEIFLIMNEKGYHYDGEESKIGTIVFTSRSYGRLEDVYISQSRGRIVVGSDGNDGWYFDCVSQRDEIMKILMRR